jgi:hypothetical protein
MKVVTSIAPTMNDPGLIAYECPRCGHLISVLDPSRDAQC